MRRLVVVAALAAACASGCGLGPGKGVRGVSLTVSDDFGARTVRTVHSARTPGADTVMRFLERRFRVGTRFGGGFVQSIDGLRGGGQVDWFYYVNGIEAPRGAASTRLHAGDRVWWDRHDWSSAMSIPAVVGAFPEPFRSGVDGHRLPVQAACAPGAGAACEEVERRLTDAGIVFGQSSLAAPGGFKTLRVLIGPWAQLRADPTARRLEGGPGASGVFVRPDASGRSIGALDPRGRVVRRLGPGTGLVAATGEHEQQTTWVVTGTDAAGMLAAARALDAGTLSHRFALAVGPSLTLPLPVVSPEASP